MFVVSWFIKGKPEKPEGRGETSGRGAGCLVSEMLQQDSATWRRLFRGLGFRV